MELDLDIKIRIKISDELNERLENGVSAAFQELESYLIDKLNDNVSHRDDYRVSQIQIDDAGPHNVVWNDDHPSKSGR